MSTNGNRVLVIFHTKQVESGSELILGIYSMHFYIQLDTPPNLCLSQTMANRILGCLPTITYHGGVPILFTF